jgi:ribosomal protein S18 acetylase RimI-like enzyme
MVASDLPRLLQIEKQPQGSRLIRHAMPTTRSSNRGVWVATLQSHMVGYLVYQISPPHEVTARERMAAMKDTSAAVNKEQPLSVDVLHLFVSAEWRRRGIGCALVERFDPRPKPQQGCRIQAAVPESDLSMQLLMRKAGFRAECILREYYLAEDAYLMERIRS